MSPDSCGAELMTGRLSRGYLREMRMIWTILPSRRGSGFWMTLARMTVEMATRVISREVVAVDSP
jgi:hypothetical protein